MLPEAGHHTGTFRLARTLRARGHEVVYLGLADLEPIVAAQGFDFVPFAADLLPSGSIGAFKAARDGAAARGPIGRWRRRRSDGRVFSAFLDRITSGHLDVCLRACRPDVLLCDTFVWYVALRARRLEIPTLNISIVLSLHRNARIPPVVFSLPPGSAPWRVLFSWTWMRAKFFFTKRLASFLFGAFRFPTRMHHLLDVFKRIARSSGDACVEDETYRFGEFGPRLRLPEIVLCPRAFQLPGAPEDDGRRYLGDCIDRERHEAPLEGCALHAARPLVLCSLGTYPRAYPHAARFFRAVREASALRKDWQLVLHVADHPARPRPGPSEENLIVREEVPQLALLRRAAAMVTHGGMNSIMECIRFQVPLVVVPGLRDQPGNATRAVHHGLALRASMAGITGQGLVRLVARAMEDGAIRQALAAMERRIAEEKGLVECIALIEERGRPSG